MALAAGLAAGCAHVNDPFKDSSLYIDAEMNTASAEGYRAAPEFRTVVLRESPHNEVRYENGTVTHWPLWFEDPFEDKGNGVTDESDRDAPDNEFAWNGADYLHILYGPGRFILNAAAWPVSVVVRHPGMLMESDGRISKGIWWYDHDAQPSDSVNREPPDFNRITKHRDHETQEHADEAAAPAESQTSQESIRIDTANEVHD